MAGNVVAHIRRTVVAQVSAVSNSLESFYVYDTVWRRVMSFSDFTLQTVVKEWQVLLNERTNPCAQTPGEPHK